MAQRKLSRASRARKKNDGKKQEESTDTFDLDPNEDDEIQSEDPGDELLPDLTLKDLPKNCDSLLYDYLQRNELLGNEYVVSLYKYDQETGERKTFCSKFVGDIPDEDMVGREFGAGRYCAILQVQDKYGKKRGTVSKFKLHQRYDALKQQGGTGLAFMPQMPVPGSKGDGGNDLNNAIRLIQVMLGTFTPLIKMMQQPTASSSEKPIPESYGEIMASNYKVMNEAMKEMYLDNTQFFNDMQRKHLDLPELVEGDGESGGVVGVVQSIMPLFEKFLPLITTKGAQGQATVQTIKNLPQYKDVIKDKKTIIGLYNFIKEKHGQSVAKSVLSKFKIKLPPTRKKEEKKVK